MFGSMVLSCLFMMAFLMLIAFLEKGAYSSLTPAEVNEFKKWFHEPIRLTAPQSKIEPPLPPMILQEHSLLVRDAGLQYEGLGPFITEPNALFQRLMDGNKVTFQELDTATSISKEISPLTDRAVAMLSYPGYHLAANYFSTALVIDQESRQSQLEDLTLLILSQAALEATTGNYTTALEKADVAVNLVHHHPLAHENLYHPAITTIESLHELIKLVASKTTDTAVLNRTLELLKRHRDLIRQLIDAAMIPAEGVVLELQMVEDGYRSSAVMTPASVQLDVIKRLDYYKWLLKNLPQNSPRRETVELMKTSVEYTISSSSPAWVQHIVEVMQIGPGKLALGKLMHSFSLAEMTSLWKRQKLRIGQAKLLLAQHDLLELALARHIAETTSSHLRQYLEAIPADPFTNGPFRSSETTGKFYSVGPDGKDSSGDEIEEPAISNGFTSPVMKDSK